MDESTVIWSGADLEVHRVVVGPLANNVYVLRCRRSAQAVLIDAAAESERLVHLADALGVVIVLETHGHHDHVGAIPALRASGRLVWGHPEDVALFPTLDRHLAHDQVIEVGELRVRVIHTPGHTPGSTCFFVEGSPVLFSGDTLFPGGPGATAYEGGDFPTIIASIDQQLFDRFGDDVIVLPGHGAPTTIGAERTHLDDWIARGW